MSDYEDGPELDEDDIQQLLEDSEDQLTPENFFGLTLLNTCKNKRVWVQLEDKDGDQIELGDMVNELISYVENKLDDPTKSNQLLDQIMPLMTQIVSSALGRMYGLNNAAFLLLNENIRIAIIHMMMVSFVLYKVVQVKNLKISTTEEEVSDEEIAEARRQSRAHSMVGMNSMLGVDPKETLQSMLNNGEITEADLSDLLGQRKNEKDES
jgi:hypothetical protein